MAKESVLVNLTRFQKQIFAAAVDLILLPLVVCIAIWLRYEDFSLVLLKQYIWLVVAAPLVSIPIFIRLGLYRAVIRFIDQKIVYVVLFGVSVSTIILAALIAFATHMMGISRGVFVIYWISAIMYMVSSRFLARGYINRSIFGMNVPTVAIYGAGKAGIQLAAMLRSGGSLEPVAFIDDRPEMHGSSIAGLIVHPADKLAELVSSKKIQEVLLALPDIDKREQKRILAQLEPLKVKIKVTPPLDSLMNGELRLQDVRNIEIEDLLGRDTVEPFPSLIGAGVTGMSVMVTGAGGSIGSELCRQIARLKPRRLVLLEISEYALYKISMELTALKTEAEIYPLLGSVLEEEQCERILKAFAVDTVYHAAAYKHVPLVEHNPIEGIRNNVFGTLAIAKAALSAQAKSFVLISSDKAVRPANVMGSTKRLAELILQALSKLGGTTKFSMVRFGNVLGSSGSVVPLFRKQIMAGGPITVTHPDVRRYFMTIPEAAQLVLQAGGMSASGDVFVLDMGEPIRIFDLAKTMVRLSGLELKSEQHPDGIAIEFTGLRPGEKMYEELMLSNQIERTEHPLIMRTHESEIPWNELEGLLKKLEKACDQFDCVKAHDILMQSVNEYTPQGDIEDLIWRQENNYRKVGSVRHPRRSGSYPPSLRVVE